MRTPFGRLIEMVDAIEGDRDVTLGELSERWGEPVWRIADAIDASKMLRGEPGYLGGPVYVPETMSVRAAAQALEVHENTVRNWMDRGWLEYRELPSGFRRPMIQSVQARRSL